MVRRCAWLFGALLLCSACASNADSVDELGVVLHGFKLVDPNDHTVREADLCLANGAVCPPGISTAKFQHIQGNGRFLMPALWDLSAALWGNDSALSYEVLYQEMSISQSLRVQLYYGVAHVGTFGMQSQWVLRERKRAHALGYPAAELIFPDQALAGRTQFSCVAVQKTSDIAALLDERKSHDTPFVRLYYGAPSSKQFPGLSKELLAQALEQAAQRGLEGYVVIEDWQHAREAAELGAAFIYGLPDGPVPDDLIALFREKNVAFAAGMAGFELDRVLGNEQALADPFLTVAVSAPVLATYHARKALWNEWSPELQSGQQRQAITLLNLRRLAEGGVHVVQVSDAGWAAGTFQGYSALAAQEWLERAGLDPWARLSAATLWPAQFAGRQVSFAPGAPADFIALDADPLQRAVNLRKLSFVIRDGKVVERSTLKPDLTRERWHQ